MAFVLCCSMIALGWTQLPDSGPRSDPAAHLVLGGARYPISDHGAVGPREPGRPGLSEDRGRPWPIRVRIARELRWGAESATLAPAQLPAIREALAGFVTAVAEMTAGRVRIVPEIEVFERPVVVPAGMRVGPWFPVPMAGQNLGIPGRGVESVFLVFPAGTRDWPMLGGTYGGDQGPDGAGASAIAWVPLRRQEMVRVLVHEWLHQIEWLARVRGGMPWFPGSHDLGELGFDDEMVGMAALLGELLSPAFWQRASMRGAAVKLDRLPKPPATASIRRRWSAVAADPFRRLPLLNDEDLSRRLGRRVSLRVGPGFVELVEGAKPSAPVRPAVGAPRVDARLDLHTESVLCARVGPVPSGVGPSQFLVVVRGDRVGAWGPTLPGVPWGVLLPLRGSRSVGAWSAGGTATPLVAFLVELPAPPQTEVELMELGGQGWKRGGQKAVVGQPLVFAVPRGAGILARVDGFRVSRQLWPIVPRGTRPLRLSLRRGPDRLDFRIPVAPRVEITLGTAGRGPIPWLRGGRRVPCTLRNHTALPITLRLRGEVPAGVDLRGLPEEVRLPAGGAQTLNLRLEVRGMEGADVPPRRWTLRVRAATGGSEWGMGSRPVWQATGTAFLRREFETLPAGEGARPRVARPWFPRGRGLDAVPTGAGGPIRIGEWSGVVRRRGGRSDDGGAWLQLSDGGGSRFGSYTLMSARTPAYDTGVFPLLDFWFMAKAPRGARAALNLTVSGKTVSLPLVGTFLRRWDHRRALPRPDLEIVLDGRWQRVVYDLDAALHAVLGEGPHRVTRIEIGDTRALCSNRFRGDDAAVFGLDSFRVARTGR